MNWFLKFWRLINGKTYRVILIDPETRSIKELQSEVSTETIHELVGAELLDHVRFAKHSGDGGYDTGWVDDGGLSAGVPVHAFLLRRVKDGPFAGRCLITGADRNGEVASARLSIAVLRRDVKWLGVILPKVTWEQTELGAHAVVTYSQVK